jgi:signal transduction histidine kinase
MPTRFPANISHELRTPLHGILLSSEVRRPFLCAWPASQLTVGVTPFAIAQLMSDTKLDDQQSSYLQTVQACGISLIETVNHVLDYTKLSGNTGRVSGAEATTDRGIQKSEVDLAQLIEETVEGCWMGQRARALIGDSEIGSVYAPPPSTVLREDGQLPLDRPQVECVVDIPWREEGWRVNLEKGGVRRVLMNLVSNALKFTTDGYVLVTLRALPAPEDAEAIPLEIAVIDTGKGISKDFLQSQLFQPFSQENPLQTGTGLGLAIVNSIVSSDAVRGKVDVWSTQGLGTEIKVSLDAVPARRRHSVDSSASLVDFGLGISVTFLGFDERIRGFKLLRDVLEMNLQDWGFEARPSTVPGWGDILLVNESESVVDHFTEQGNVGRPIVIFSTSRSAVEQLRAVQAYVSAGRAESIILSSMLTSPFSILRL